MNESMVDDSESVPPDREVGEDVGAAKIADPEDYTLRRRLKQIHDAKERVLEIRERSTFSVIESENFTEKDRALVLAEALADYITELEPVLEQLEQRDEFLEEEVGEVNSQEISIEDVVERRGQISVERARSASVGDSLNGSDSSNGVENVPIPYDASMKAYRICNRYLERFAGSRVEEGLPTDPGFDATVDEREVTVKMRPKSARPNQ